MPPTAAPAAPAGAAPADAKTTAGNIVKGVTDRATGKPPEKPADGDEKKPAGTEAGKAPDPNEGKRKFVVNGKEVWLDQKQADAYVQKGIAFEPRISELARLQQETAALLQTLKEAPEKVLFDKRVGLTPQAALERILSSSKVSDEIKESVGKWYYEHVVKKAKMSDAERAILERDERIAELESTEKRKQEEAIARENKARIDQMMSSVKGQIAEAMKEIGLPSVDTPIGVQLAKRVADVMRLSYLARKACSPKEAANIVRGQILESQKLFYDALDEDKLVETLGKENAEKVRKYFLKIVKDAERQEKKSDGAPPPKRGERKIMTPDEFKDYLDRVKRENKVA